VPSNLSTCRQPASVWPKKTLDLFAPAGKRTFNTTNRTFKASERTKSRARMKKTASTSRARQLYVQAAVDAARGDVADYRAGNRQSLGAFKTRG
jgi:hypothetical protein